MQFPRIHLNGSSAESLIADYLQAFDAVALAVKALERVDVNGRDYYVINSEAASVAMREHRERLAKLRTVRDELMDIAVHIQRQRTR
jgi:hypothetical protein